MQTGCCKSQRHITVHQYRPGQDFDISPIPPPQAPPFIPICPFTPNLSGSRRSMPPLVLRLGCKSNKQKQKLNVRSKSPLKQTDNLPLKVYMD